MGVKHTVGLLFTFKQENRPYVNLCIQHRRISLIRNVSFYFSDLEDIKPTRKNTYQKKL